MKNDLHLPAAPAVSAWQFTFFRILFGGYLAVHFASLVPYASELFGNGGLIKDPGLNPAAGLFPNPLNLPLSGTMLMTIVAALGALSLMLAAGMARVTVSIVLWFGWTALFHRNNLIANPSIPYVGLLLLLCALVPGWESLSFGKRNPHWEMPRWVYRCAWILLAAGYTFSGFTKLFSPSWTDGSAMGYLLSNPLARVGLVRDLMLALPPVCLQLLTWLTLLAELAFLPLALWRRSRPWIWSLVVALHLGIILAVDFADLSIGMLMIHAFVFDRRWLPARHRQAILAYDGDCLMCSRAIHLIADADAEARVKFLPLHSERGRKMEITAAQPTLGSMLVQVDGRIESKSSAVIAILHTLGGGWSLLGFVSQSVPRVLRDALYDFIATNRHRWFGKSSLCSLPSAAVRERILS